MSAGPASELLHASAVALDRQGLIILGASGSGKSSLAFELIAFGATLIADDRVIAKRMTDGALHLVPPDAIAGRIEARGVGLIALPHCTANAHAVVTLDEVENSRLPAARSIVIAGVELPLLRKVESPAFPAILSAYLLGERTDP